MNVVASFDRIDKHNRGKMLEVNTFIREAQLPKELSVRIRKYFEYSLSNKKSAIFAKGSEYGYNADDILQELSSTLKTDVIMFVERDLIKKIPFFDKKSPSFVARTVQLLQPVVVQGGNYICKQDNTADEMYFLIRGRAVVRHCEKKVATLVEGDCLGVSECIMGGTRLSDVLAVTTCGKNIININNKYKTIYSFTLFSIYQT